MEYPAIDAALRAREYCARARALVCSPLCARALRRSRSAARRPLRASTGRGAASGALAAPRQQRPPCFAAAASTRQSWSFLRVCCRAAGGRGDGRR